MKNKGYKAKAGKHNASLWSLAVCALCMLAAGCIKDDIPYPHIQANIMEIMAKGESQGAKIDSVNCNVTMYFPEETNIYAVEIESYTLTPGATVVDDALSQPLDLSQPADIKLHLYYDYDWTISAVQNIERYMTVAGQIGSTSIDVPARRVLLYVTENTDLHNLKVNTIKLGAAGSVMSPDLEGETVDFSHPVEVVVTNHGHREIWTIYVDVTESVVTTARVDAWTQVAWVYGQGETGGDFGVEYRIKGDTEWTRVPQSWLTVEGGSFHARLVHLSPLTTYEARAISGEDMGQVVEFTTGANVQCPNMNFDSWWLDGKVWCPWAEGSTPYWGTGNKGATTLGPSNTVPTEDTVDGQGLAAMLQTKFVGIGIVGKLAAGNIFVGDYVRTDGTNGVLAFGREFKERPTKLRGYLKYTTAPISSVSSGFENMRNEPDTCIVWCSLIDQATPFEIRTNPSNRQLFDPEGSYVVAYGKVEYGQTISEYIPFEFDLKYTSTERVPRYILITASASKYGDYFVGANGAVLYLDNLELVYDY